METVTIIFKKYVAHESDLKWSAGKTTSPSRTCALGKPFGHFASGGRNGRSLSVGFPSHAWDVSYKIAQTANKGQGFSVPCLLRLFVCLTLGACPESEKYVGDATTMTQKTTK